MNLYPRLPTRPLPRSRSGFSLVQMIVVLAVIGLSLGLGMPALQNLVQRLRVESFGRGLTGTFQLARNQAIQETSPVVIRIDVGDDSILAFRDRDGIAAGSPPDGLFNPVDGAPEGTTDEQISFHRLPAGVEFVAPKSEDIVDGLTTVGGTRAAIFMPDGMIQDVGAIRFGDLWGNYLEIRVAPMASPRARLRKYKEKSPKGWFTREENEGPWEWYWGKGKRGK